MKNTTLALTAEIENRLGKNPKLYLDAYKNIKNLQSTGLKTPSGNKSDIQTNPATEARRVSTEIQPGFQSICNMVFKDFKKTYDRDTNLIDFILVMSHLKDLETHFNQENLAEENSVEKSKLKN